MILCDGNYGLGAYGIDSVPPTNYLQPSLNTTSRKNHNYINNAQQEQTILNIPSSPTPQWYQLENSRGVISFKASFKTSAHQGVAWCSLVFNVLTLSYFSYTFLYFTLSLFCTYVPTNACALKSQVVLLQTAHSWANAGVLSGARMHRERGSFRNN